MLVNFDFNLLSELVRLKRTFLTKAVFEFCSSFMPQLSYQIFESGILNETIKLIKPNCEQNKLIFQFLNAAIRADLGKVLQCLPDLVTQLQDLAVS